jgi:hydrogenase maturation protein HypF
MARTFVRVSGTVQGVGFRPFVYRHATELGLRGTVGNDTDGVLVDVEGEPGAVAELVRRIREEPPPLARVTAVAVHDVDEPSGATAFTIVASRDRGLPAVAVGVDVAACKACLAEVDDPSNRRYRYPFTNCTSCGPRYTIVESVPYDRAATTMAAFTMCARCQAEYDDPADRRFHAQPNACGDCGPSLAWLDPSGAVRARGEAALLAAVAALRGGRIVALKGVGGYHLAVDAGDTGAVAELRHRKARDDKPFAVMVRDEAVAARLCDLDATARAALASPRRPIVLAPARAGAPVAPGVAPGLPELGLLLPYSPLHHLLLAGVDRPLVMTSGNHSDEPIAHDDDDAIARLGPLADGLLTHDRRIHIRCDDSVARVHQGHLTLLRRSRGYAPEPLCLPVPAPRPVLAVGAELKSTVAVARGATVVASHHIGDLEHLASWRSFEQAVDHLCALYRMNPEVVAHDLHPEYLSTKFAQELDLPTEPVQHHHAHVAACLVEHRRVTPVVALAFDGLGYGPDGTLWGGEVLVADLRDATRAGHLRAVGMPGGVAAIREPWRMAVAWLAAAGQGVDADALAASFGVPAGRASAVLELAAHARTPVTSSAGRLFDAVAALLTGRTHARYEAQAAIELEAAARTVPREEAPHYAGSVEVSRAAGVAVLDPSPLVAGLAADRVAGVPVPLAAAGFHEALGRAAAALAAEVAAEHGIDAVACTGGVFQNARFTEVVAEELVRCGLTVLLHGEVPPNDGGISLGQAAVAAARDAARSAHHGAL